MSERRGEMSFVDTPLGNLSGRAGPYIPGIALGLTTASALLSVAGAIVIFYSYKKVASQRNIVRLLLVYLSIADCITALSILGGTLRYKIKYDWYFTLNESKHIVDCLALPDALCIGQSFITTYSSMCSFFWTVTIAVFFYVSVVKGTPTKPLKFYSACHLICWGIPAIITIAALAMGALGEDLSISSGAWCWISACMSTQDQLVWMIMSGKGWEILAYVVSASLFILLKYNIIVERRRGKKPFQEVNSRLAVQKHRFRVEDQHFIYLPLALYMLRVWGTVRFILGAIELDNYIILKYPQELHTFLLIMQCIGDSGQAFVNCLLYCVFDKPVRRVLFCCKPDEPLPDTETNERSSLIVPVNTSNISRRNGFRTVTESA